MAEEGFRITYATMTADNEDLHKAYDEGIEVARSWLGQKHPLFVDGEAREGSGYKAAHSPIDGSLIGEFAMGTREDVRDAVAAAKEAFHAWANRPWQERVAIIRKAADLMSEQRNELSALMAMEVGKNRLEALGDVEESADLLRWNANEVEQNDGFRKPMQSLGSPGEYYDVLRPYGVWAVISPFNFPMALAAGPSSAALVAGNSVVFKPAHMGVFTGLKLYEIYMAAGVPKGVFHFLSGPGSVVGDEIVNHPDVAGITFTGSYEVGMGIYKGFAKDFPKPVICEMGGKNPTIVTDKADLDKATDGVLRSAFGFGGQKCSANSRVYVHRSVYDEFVRRLKDKAENVKIGDPLDRDVYLGPVIDEGAVATFEEAANEAKKNGNVITGGERLTEGAFAKGTFVQPTVAEVPLDSWIWKKELFVPFVVGRALRRPRRGDPSGQRHRVRADGRLLQRGPWRDRPVVELDRGGRGVRQPAGRSHHRRVAGRAAVRRLEGIGHERQGRWRSVLRAAVPSGAVPHGDRGVTTAETLDLAAAQAPRLVTEIPGPQARARIERDHKVTSPSLPRAYELVPKRGAGSVIEDVDGNLFLDVNAGIAVTSTGHAHPAVVAAIQRQAEQLLHYSASDFYLPIYSDVCEELDRIAPFAEGARSFLTNSGTEAVEGAIKLARYATGRQNIIAMIGSFHGRSLGSVSLTASKAKYHAGFGPLLPGVVPHARSATSSTWSRWCSGAPDPARRGGGHRGRARPGRGRLRVPAGGLVPRTCGSCATGTGSCSWPTRSSRGWAGPARCGRSSTRASSPTSCWRARGSRAACRSARSWPASA